MKLDNANKTIMNYRDNSLSIILKNIFKSKIGVLVGIIGLSILFYCLSPNYLTAENLFNITRQTAINILLTLALTQVIIIGNIDLSVGSIVAFSAVTIAKMLELGASTTLGLLAALIVGTSVGLFNGAAYSLTNMPPFIATLATQTIFRGVSMIVTGGYPININNDFIIFLGRGNLFGVIPVPLIIALFLYCLHG